MPGWRLDVARAEAGLALTLRGRLEPGDRAALAAACARVPLSGDQSARVELADLEPPGGVALALLVDALRALAARAARVELHHAPQMLAHTLYKTGLLRSGRLRVVSAGEPEQPYGG